MLHLLKSYLTFLYSSTNQYGVHSPFVFNLVTKCFYDTKKYSEYSIVENHKREKNSVTKKVEISLKQAKLLFRIVNYFQPETVLVVGLSSDLVTETVSLGNPKAKITSINNLVETSNLKSEMYNLTYFNNQTIHTFEKFLPTTSNDSVWIFSAIHLNSENEKTWEIIKNHPKVRITIDTYKLGFVFFRTEQEKEHFTIRV